jgi:hypothetical protein
MTESSTKKSFFSILLGRIDGIMAIVGLVALGFGAPYWLDDHYARASEVVQLKEQFEQQQLESRQFSVQQNIFALTNKYKDTSKMSIEDKINLQKLQDLLKRVNDRLEVLDKKLGLTP